MTFSLPRGGAMGPGSATTRPRVSTDAATAARPPRAAPVAPEATLAPSSLAAAEAPPPPRWPSRGTRWPAARFSRARPVAIPALFDVGAALAKAKGKGGQGSPPTKAVAPTPVTNVDLAGRRLVAIGPAITATKQTMRALELGKVMDADGRWVGGTTVLVQVGDILDRGDNELAAMRKFASLAKQARRRRGRARRARQPRDHRRAR